MNHPVFIFNSGGSVWGLDWCPIIGKRIFYIFIYIYIYIYFFFFYIYLFILLILNYNN